MLLFYIVDCRYTQNLINFVNILVRVLNMILPWLCVAQGTSLQAVSQDQSQPSTGLAGGDWWVMFVVEIEKLVDISINEK